MAPKPSATDFLSFEDYDELRLRVALAIVPSMIEQALDLSESGIVGEPLKGLLAEECMEWTDAFMRKFYRDRLEVSPATCVDLAAEAMGG